jgi:hypothetical protein
LVTKISVVLLCYRGVVIGSTAVRAWPGAAELPAHIDSVHGSRQFKIAAVMVVDCDTGDHGTNSRETQQFHEKRSNAKHGSHRAGGY